MPELPEVETIVRNLRPRLRGQTIVSIRAGKQALRRPWNRQWEAALRGRRIMDLRRRGKWIIMELSEKRHLLLHLGMTGQLCITPQNQTPESHTHLAFRLSAAGKELRFRDVRRFGCVHFLTRDGLEPFFEAQRLGPEPSELTAQALRDRLRATRRCLKAVLLDQRVLAGVGNIYADESLFEARLSPAQLGNQTTPKQADQLRRAIITVLNRAVEKNGSSIRDYLDGNGRQGGYQHEFRVYQRTGEPCRRCRTPIVQVRLAGRSTHFCPKCQKSGEGRMEGRKIGRTDEKDV